MNYGLEGQAWGFFLQLDLDFIVAIYTKVLHGDSKKKKLTEILKTKLPMGILEKPFSKLNSVLTSVVDSWPYSLSVKTHRSSQSQLGCTMEK